MAPAPRKAMRAAPGRLNPAARGRGYCGHSRLVRFQRTQEQRHQWIAARSVIGEPVHSG